jgi:hypothetical protein
VVTSSHPHMYGALVDDRIYGGWWDPVIDHDAKQIVERSAARYIEIVPGDFDPAPQPTR